MTATERASQQRLAFLAACGGAMSIDRGRVVRAVLAVLVPLLAGGAWLLLVHSAHAQGGQSGNERAFINEYARPGRPTMTIYAWGAVGRSGIWRVERDVGIIEFLSAANVPGLGTDQVETRERYLLRLYREEGTGRTQIYESQLEEVIENTGEVPALQGGDVLVLERQQKRRWSFRTISQYVGTASTLVLLFLRLGLF